MLLNQPVGGIPLADLILSKMGRSSAGMERAWHGCRLFNDNATRFFWGKDFVKNNFPL